MKKMISRRNFLKAAALAGSAMALSACGGKSSASGQSGCGRRGGRPRRVPAGRDCHP